MVDSTSQDALRYAILCVEDDPEMRQVLSRDLTDIVEESMEVEVCGAASEAVAVLERLEDECTTVPLIIADHILPGQRGADLLVTLHERHPNLRATKKVLLSGQTSLDDVTRALNRGALNRHINKPFTREVLQSCVQDLLTEYFLEHCPADVHRFSSVIDLMRLSSAYEAQRQTLAALGSQLKVVQRSFLGNMEMSDETVEKAVIEGIDRALGNPPRKQLPADSILIREGEKVSGISIVESGVVQLTKKVDDEEISFHSSTSGRIIGLLSLAHRRKAFFTCRATTPVTIIPLTLEQLNDALQKAPELSVHFVTALIRSLATRNRHVAELRSEVIHLNAELGHERDNLQSALAELERAHMRLVESEKLATLGQLSAGIAHELNNPVAAIQRAVDFIAEDMIALTAARPHGEELKNVTLAALTQDPLSTREARALQSRLTEEMGSSTVAKRLIRVGIRDPQEYSCLVSKLGEEKATELLAMMERHHQLGTSLRNLSNCSDRISDLVKSLRSYARTNAEAVAEVNLHTGLNDTLLMFNHALRDVEVKRHYGDLPEIKCHPGELNQVWTNLIANALGAMRERGQLLITTDCPDNAHVRVAITDSGPGIPADLIDRVFETNFTTKSGNADFGLGLGLPICRQIVARHNGAITLDSEPGKTTATVTLPVCYKRLPGEKE